MDTDRVVGRLTEAVEVLKQVETNLRTSNNEVFHKCRPDHRKVRVLIRASILSLGEIDTVKQEFSVDIWLAAWYKEPLLKGKKHRDEVDWDDQWDPRIVLFNAVSIDTHVIRHHLILEEGDDVPIVQISNRIKATFKEPMELEDFPFDHQELTIQLMSDWPIHQVEFAKNMGIKDTIRTDTFTGSHEWELYGHLLCKPAVTNQDQSTSHNRYPRYNITAHVQRKMGFYVWNIAFIMFLIMALSFTAFSVPANDPADRLSVTLTLLLTSVAFKFVVTQSLPTISYLTLLDKYVLLCMVFQCLMAVQNALASLFNNSWLFDAISTAVLAAMVVFTHLVFGITIWIKIRETTKLLKGADKEYLHLCESIDRFYRRTKCTISGFTDEEVEAIMPPPDFTFGNLKQVKMNKPHSLKSTVSEPPVELPGTVQENGQPGLTKKLEV